MLEPRTLQDLIDDANDLLDETDDAVPRPAGWVAWRLGTRRRRVLARQP
ncbi:hypothetical protein Q9Q99_11225 [Curtobacterium flaccumfaciens]|nr:hypothetical protein Q9Q99_11225 [Curtobacterium flaccumfaciens]